MATLASQSVCNMCGFPVRMASSAVYHALDLRRGRDHYYTHAAMREIARCKIFQLLVIFRSSRPPTLRGLVKGWDFLLPTAFLPGLNVYDVPRSFGL